MELSSHYMKEGDNPDESTKVVVSPLDVLRQRAAGKNDSYKIGLALEGGGMRGVVSGAMLIALRELGLSPYVDTFYGTSSGSINLAYFAAGASWDGLSVYYDHLPFGFVRRPVLPHRPPLDMGFVFDHVMRTEVPLDVASVATSELDVCIVLTDVDSCKPCIVHVREVADELREYLKAGSWLPILSGSPYRLHGRRYLDGGVLWADPIYAAIEDGCTHVIALNTDASGSAEHSKRMRVLLRAVLNGWSPGLGDEYVRSRLRWDEDRARIRPGEPTTLAGASVVRLQPAAGAHRVKRLTTDRGDLLDGARAGYSMIFRQFTDELPKFYFSITK